MTWTVYESYGSEEFEVPDSMAESSDDEILEYLRNEICSSLSEAQYSKEHSPESILEAEYRSEVEEEYDEENEDGENNSDDNDSDEENEELEAGDIEAGRFEVVGDGTVIDTKTGLMWAAEDSWREDKSGSSSGENWEEAKAYCESFRGGNYSDWRMPTLDELKELYAAFIGKSFAELESKFWSKGNSVGTYVGGKAINVPIWIYWWIWSSDQRSSEAAYLLGFGNGDVGWDAQSDRRYNFRALPVRFRK